MKTLLQIEGALTSGHVSDAFEELLSFLEENPDNAEAWYLLGGIYRRQQLWGDAINAYNKSKMIDPEGPADAAIESIYNIIRFVNKDLMNP